MRLCSDGGIWQLRYYTHKFRSDEITVQVGLRSLCTSTRGVNVCLVGSVTLNTASAAVKNKTGNCVIGRNESVPEESSVHPFLYHNRLPRIACFNIARTPLGVDFNALITAMQKFVDEHFAPVWGAPAKLVASTGFLKGAWAMAFVDNTRDASLEGYHEVTPEGLPMSKVFVKDVLKQKDQVSVAASHELAEMLVDPGANLYSTGPKKNHLYDYEVADPVEELFFEVNGIPMTNFVYPAYFETFHKEGSTRFDHMGELRRPFDLHKGGYQSYWVNGKEKTEWGSEAKKVRFQKEDRRGHRSSFRHKANRRQSVVHY